MSNNLTVEVFKGQEASVNSYLFSNGTSLMVMDVLRNTEEAKILGDFISAKGLPLTHIFITHGHPDHYIGMDHLKKKFPDAAIVVASKEVKQDIIGFSTWMESVGWLEGEPHLKPKSASNPNGFDYQGQIQVLNQSTFPLEGGGILEITTDYRAAEAEHLTTVYAPELNALFTSDFCYNGVHLWLGPGVDAAHIDNWKTELNHFKAKYTAADLKVYPGHGNSSGIALFDEVLNYLTAFEDTIARSTSKEEAFAAMQSLYPDWQQADFLLQFSLDHHMSLKESK